MFTYDISLVCMTFNLSLIKQTVLVSCRQSPMMHYLGFYVCVCVGGGGGGGEVRWVANLSDCIPVASSYYHVYMQLCMNMGIEIIHGQTSHKLWRVNDLMIYQK